MSEKIEEGLIGSLLGKDQDSSLANPKAVNPEEIKKELADDVKQAIGNDNVDVSKCSTEELLALLQKTSNVNEGLNIVRQNISKYDESVIKKAMIDRYGFLEDEATNIYESLCKNTCDMSVDELYDALDDAAEKGYIPNKYLFDMCFDDCFVPTSLDDCLNKYGVDSHIEGSL